MNPVKRVFAAMKGSKQIPLFITLCTVILGKVTGNPLLPNPPVSLVLMAQHLLDLQNAEKAALHGPKGAAQDRNFKLGIVRGDFRQLKEYIQSMADAAGPQGAALIESSGMTVSKKPQRTKSPFAASYGKVPGRVRLDVKAARRPVTYYWSMSSDQQKTWISLPETNNATTNVDSLTAGTIYAFRFRTLTKTGLSDWSSVITIVAH